MYKILEKQVLSDVTKLVVVDAPHVARKAKAGQFVIVIVDEQGERIPLTIADCDAQAGTITLIFQEVGKSTMQMGLLEVGDAFPFDRRSARPPHRDRELRHGRLRGGRRGHRAHVSRSRAT